MSANDDHQFDRRKSDVRYDSLDLRMKVLEEHVFDVLTPIVRRSETNMAANTALTEETHGIASEMYEVFTVAKNGVQIIGKVGDGIMWFADKMEKLGKPFFYLALLSAAVWAYFRTGVFHWPKWD